MLKKLEFNNAIISARGNILSGRVQTITKVVRRIRKLKEQLQMRPDDKLNEKLAKYISIMEFIKKLKPNEIIVNILLLRRSSEAILSNGLADAEENGLALLAMNKNIKQLIEKLKLEFNLKDEFYDTWSHELKQNKRTRNQLSNGKIKMAQQSQQTNGAKDKSNQMHNCDPTRKTNRKLPNNLVTNRIQHMQDETKYTNTKPNKRNYVHTVDKSEVKFEKLHKTNASEKMESNAVELNTKTERHPSWIAKQKFKSIQPFQGKKITFADKTEIEDNKNQELYKNVESKTSKKNENGLTASKNITNGHQHKRNSGLHPSWVAKQKLKSVVQFQGKKITFND